jgi:hypothetical protein
MSEEYNPFVMDLESDEITITNENPVFKDSPFETVEFELTIKPVSTKEFERFRAIYHIGKRGSKDSEFEKRLFLDQVVGWKGIKDTSGKEIPCTEETKIKVYERYSFFAKSVNAATLNARMITEETERKN